MNQLLLPLPPDENFLVWPLDILCQLGRVKFATFSKSSGIKKIYLIRFQNPKKGNGLSVLSLPEPMLKLINYQSINHTTDDAVLFVTITTCICSLEAEKKIIIIIKGRGENIGN